MSSSIDSNIIIRAIFDKNCEDAFRRFCSSENSFLCFTVNKEVHKKQLDLFFYLRSIAEFLKDKKGIRELIKTRFFRDFSNEFEEMYDYINECSENFENTKELIKTVDEMTDKQRDFIDLRNIIVDEKLYPRREKEVREILNKKEIIDKWNKAKRVPAPDRRHLCISQDYGANKIFEKVLFVTYDISHLSGNPEYIKNIFDFVDISGPEEYVEDYGFW